MPQRYIYIYIYFVFILYIYLLFIFNLNKKKRKRNIYILFFFSFSFLFPFLFFSIFPSSSRALRPPSIFSFFPPISSFHFLLPFVAQQPPPQPSNHHPETSLLPFLFLFHHTHPPLPGSVRPSPSPVLSPCRSTISISGSRVLSAEPNRHPLFSPSDRKPPRPSTCNYRVTSAHKRRPDLHHNRRRSCFTLVVRNNLDPPLVTIDRFVKPAAQPSFQPLHCRAILRPRFL